MANYFQVELDTLGRYVTTLESAQQQLAGLPRLMSGNDSQLGNDKLNEAAVAFQESWERGGRQLGDAVLETTDAVREVARAYAEADRAAEEAITSVSRPPG